MRKSILLAAPILFLVPTLARASSGGGGGGDMLHMMSQLIMQLGVIVLIARLIGLLFRYVKLPFPSIPIEVTAGVLIGPYLLGGVPLPGFPDGIFPLSTVTALPISPELYGIATIASIIMLFSAGLETNLSLLLKFSVVGLIVGLSGVILPFAAGAGSGVMFYGLPFDEPAILFIGLICTTTSVGITARILSERRKMDSPEGVTILAAAVTDDVLGIITLTVVTGIIAAKTLGAEVGIGEAADWTRSVWVVGKAVLVWLGFTAAGILFAAPLARLLKRFKSVTCISVASLAIAFLLSGIFEMAGLAMVIGAYIVGLSLSKTDLTDTIRDSLETLHDFFVPIFFIVMGMLVDPRSFMSREVLIFGGIYTAFALVSTIIGCGVPALFLNFNRLGALRIGMGMVPHGEVSLIIAGIGLSSGFIDQRFFGAAVMMVLVSVFIAPPFASLLFKGNAKGTKKTFDVRHTVTTPVELESYELTDLLELRIVKTFRAEGFFVHSTNLGAGNVYHLRKNASHITLHRAETVLEFESDARDVLLIKTIAYEALLELNTIVTRVKDVMSPENLLKDLTTDTAPDPDDTKTRTMDMTAVRALARGSIIPNLNAKTKEDVVTLLVHILYTEGRLLNGSQSRDDAIKAVMEREASMSTGMQWGIAIPHARTDAVDKVTLSVGLSKKGIDYQSLDGELSKIFVLILSPLSSESSHIQVLANISAMLNGAEAREKLLACRTQEEIYSFFQAGLH